MTLTGVVSSSFASLDEFFAALVEALRAVGPSLGGLFRVALGVGVAFGAALGVPVGVALTVAALATALVFGFTGDQSGELGASERGDEGGGTSGASERSDESNEGLRGRFPVMLALRVAMGLLCE